ncbi:MAG: NlpC/P60 family protein [Verrucomicrobiales bacterium]
MRAGSAENLFAHCQRLSRRGLRYQYGACDPASGGLDCSGTVQFLLQKQGISGVPRQANTQYLWLQKARSLRIVDSRMTQERLLSEVRPGDLLFWEGTYEVQRSPNITHVMVYVGFDRATGKHLMFGARGGMSKGLTGNEVDYFEFKGLRRRGKGRLAGFGHPPGLL